jgi:hypothetical protein
VLGPALGISGINAGLFRVYGPKVGALGKKGKQQVAQSSLALAKEMTLERTLHKRHLPSRESPLRQHHLIE